MWRHFFSNLLNFIIPPRTTEKIAATITLDDLLALKVPSPHTYGATLPYTDERVTAIVWELKYYANKNAARLAGESLREELLEIASEEIGVPVLIPTPMHKKRRRERGHNQTEILCKAALHDMKDTYMYNPRALVRIRHTPQQRGLTKEARLRNVENAMRVTQPETVRGRTCVIVDDVVTTGATLHEAKRALLEAGAQKVFCLSLAAAL